MLASALRMHFVQQGKKKTFDERTLERQCDHEYLEEIRNIMDNYDAVLSLACGVGVQFMAEKYHTTPLLPGVNTCFWGATEKRGLWTERLPGLWVLCACLHRRYLPYFPVRQACDEWSPVAVPPVESARSTRMWTVPGS